MNDSTRRQDQLADEVIRRVRCCLPAEDLVAYHDGTMGANNRHTLEAHLPDCLSCQAALEYLVSDAARQPGGQMALPQAVEERIEALMAAAVREEAESPSRYAPGRAWMKLAAGVFLAASLALFGYVWWSPAGFDQDLGGLRSNETLQVLSPAGRIDTLPDSFRWTSHPLAKSYLVLLFDEEMNEIWQGRTSDDDTELSLDGAAMQLLAAGGRFSWQVIALDGKDYGFDQSSIGHFESGVASSTR